MAKDCDCLLTDFYGRSYCVTRDNTPCPYSGWWGVFFDVNEIKIKRKCKYAEGIPTSRLSRLFRRA